MDAPFSLYEFLLLQMSTVASFRRADVQAAARLAAFNDSRAEAIAALVGLPAGEGGSDVLVDVGGGVRAAARVQTDALFYDLGAGVFVELSLRDALVLARKTAADARSAEALAEHALATVARDVLGAVDAVEQLREATGQQ
jgi:prefoldin subunit 5